VTIISKIFDGRVISRRGFLSESAGAITSASLLSSAVAQVVAPPSRILTYTDHEPLGGMRTRFINDVLFPAIGKESNGRLNIVGHWEGQLAGSYDALRAVGNTGVADMAIVVPEYTAKELPLHQIFKSFPKGPSASRQVDFFRSVYAEAPAFSEELKKNNVVPIFLATGYPVAFFSTKPLNNLNGLKGEKWRSASFWHQDFLKNAGATPVSMHWGPEIYDALKARTLDGLMVNVDSGYMLKVHEAAPYVLVSKDLWLGHLYVLAMNNDIWNGLAPEDRAAIQRAAETSYRTLGSVMDQSFDAQVDELRKGGANVRILDPNELERWGADTKYKDVQDAWVREQQRKGATNVGPVFEKVNSIMNDVMG